MSECTVLVRPTFTLVWMDRHCYFVIQSRPLFFYSFNEERMYIIQFHVFHSIEIANIEYDIGNIRTYLLQNQTVYLRYLHLGGLNITPIATANSDGVSPLISFNDYSLNRKCIPGFFISISGLVRASSYGENWQKMACSVETSRVSLEDCTCPVCMCILIEPVTMPCHHELCRPCFKQNVEEASLLCPMCRTRIGTWARHASKTKTLVNQQRWQQIQELFPKRVRLRLEGKDEEDDSADGKICFTYV